MAWNTKYVSYFTSESGKYYTFEIKEEDWASGSTEIKMGEEPFIINSAEGDLTDTVIGTGAEISLISTTSLQLTNLFTDDKFKYKVFLSTGGKIQWEGWLNSETYEEVYTEYKNYNVSMVSNDGLAMLDTIDYLNDSGDPYEGIQSAFEIIINVLSKTASFTKLHIAKDALIILDKNNSVITPGTNKTFLDVVKLINENYYDETNKPMTCRKVLESILETLGLTMRVNTTLFNDGTDTLVGYVIYDSNTVLATTNKTFYTYNPLTGTYISSWTYTSAGYNYDLGSIDKKGTGFTMNYTDIINNQNITYSPYSVKDILKAELVEEDFCETSSCDNFDSALDFSGVCPNDTKWSEWIWKTHPDFAILDAFYVDICEEIQGVEGITEITRGSDYYMRTQIFNGMPFSSTLFKTTVPNTKLYGYYDSTKNDLHDWGLLVNFKVQIAAKVCSNTPSYNIYDYAIGLTLHIGSYNIDFTSFISKGKGEDRWQSNTYYSPSSQIPVAGTLGEMNPNSVPALLEMTAPQDGTLVSLSTEAIANIVNGEDISLTVTKYTNAKTKIPAIDLEAHHFRFKDFSITLVKDLSNKADYGVAVYSELEEDDVVIDSTINSLARNDGSDISLIHGTRAISGGNERGMMLYESTTTANAYYAINKIDKGLLDDLSVPLYFTAEQWILNKILSNYKQPRVRLSGVKVKATGIDSNVTSRFTDTAQFPTKKMLPLGYSYNVYEDSITFNLVEAVKDSMDIIAQ